MSQLRRAQEEFTRQADTFDAYAPRADARVDERFCAALGAEPGRVLDLACGPGVVTVAVARIATDVTAFDATPAMLDKARARCAGAGLDNVVFEQGDAGELPFDDGYFDAVVTRLAIHHFEAPAAVLAEIARVLPQGGKLVIADVIVSDDPAEAALQNAIENLRDPSHVRMLPLNELAELLDEAGLRLEALTTWRKEREFEDWMATVNAPLRTQSLRVVARTLAESGHTAGMGLRIHDGNLLFFHQWVFLTATRPR